MQESDFGYLSPFSRKKYLFVLVTFDVLDEALALPVIVAEVTLEPISLRRPTWRRLLLGDIGLDLRIRNYRRTRLERSRTILNG